MGNALLDQIGDGICTSFINQSINSDPFLRPQFISNDHTQGKKVLCSIKEELAKCAEFYISVAFITMGGLTPLLQVLRELEERGIPGKILTTDYLTFSEPKALTKLHEFKNIELKMYLSNDDRDGFHTKGYIFKDALNETYRIIVGSSNITMNALTVNKEWNTRIISTKEGEYAVNILDEFQTLWDSPNSKNYNQFIYDYETKYNIVEHQKLVVRQSETPVIQDYLLQPNSMQINFTQNLEKLMNQGAEKALLISATGTGKTYASAFAIRELNPQRILFIVHREQIARQALLSYQKVFDRKIEMGIVSGTSEGYDAQFVFSTMQMMAKDQVRERYQPDDFDVIVIDEVHRAGAESYRKIMEYFKPILYLGMTASPDRMDGFNIYELFDHNIAHEIRLQEALEEDLLCPFHYFGITDFQLEDGSERELSDFNYLTQDTRVDYILKMINYYGYSGDRVKGLIFCSTKNEAHELSTKFNSRGLKTCVLTGDDTQDHRQSQISRLTGESSLSNLDYIFTVDIFNEGVDIPEINQVIMLRPTESPIIFIQQLGRGLRKARNKEYVVILDFIGNHQNNYMIPMALFGDRSYNKDNVRRAVREGTRIIPGSSSINFDEISRKLIYESIDSANFSEAKIIKEAYQNLKFKLGRIPGLMDFDEHGSIDVLRIFENKTLRSYYGLLKKYEKEAYPYTFDSVQINMLEYISQKFAAGKRVHELIVLKDILLGHDHLLQRLQATLNDEYDLPFDDNTRINVINILTGNFLTGSSKDTFKDSIFIQRDEIAGDYRISESFKAALTDSEFRRMTEELVEYGFARNKADYPNPYLKTPLNLYAKYTYEEVCRLLEWEKADVALNIGGYKFDKNSKTYPVFINYEKDGEIAHTIRYEDRFLSPGELIAISKSGRTVNSEDVKTALKAEDLGVRMELFVRKNKDDKASKEFYYLGRIRATGETKEFIMPNTTKTSVEIRYQLKTNIREDLYDYIVN